MSVDLVFGRKWDGSIWENVDALNPSFRFYLLSFQPRSSKVLNRDFFYIFQDLWKLPKLFSPDPNPCPHNLEPLLQL